MASWLASVVGWTVDSVPDVSPLDRGLECESVSPLWSVVLLVPAVTSVWVAVVAAGWPVSVELVTSLWVAADPDVLAPVEADVPADGALAAVVGAVAPDPLCEVSLLVPVELDEGAEVDAVLPDCIWVTLSLVCELTLPPALPPRSAFGAAPELLGVPVLSLVVGAVECVVSVGPVVAVEPEVAPGPVVAECEPSVAAVAVVWVVAVTWVVAVGIVAPVVAEPVPVEPVVDVCEVPVVEALIVAAARASVLVACDTVDASEVPAAFDADAATGVATTGCTADASAATVATVAAVCATAGPVD